MTDDTSSRLRGAIVPVTPFQQNCAVLWDEGSKRALVIDPGGDVPRILDAIDQMGLTVERILLTHGHLDHAGGATELAEALSARPGASPVPIDGPDRRDAFLLDGIEKQAAGYGWTAKNVTPDRWLADFAKLDIRDEIRPKVLKANARKILGI